MPNKCCVYGCNGNYNADNLVTVFKIPLEETERDIWISKLPKRSNENGLPYVYSKHTFICVRHWPGFPENVPHKKVPGGSLRPLIPPFEFPNVPRSCIPCSSSASPRQKVDIAKRQMDSFNAKDRLEYADLNKMEERYISVSVKGKVVSEKKQLAFIFDTASNVDVPNYQGYIIFENISGTLSDTVVHAFDDKGNKLNIYTCVGPHNQVNRWSQLDECINIVKNHVKSTKQQLQIALDAISSIQKDEHDDSDRLEFITRQLELHISKRYSERDYLFAAQCFPKMPYDSLRNYIVLPASRKMRELKSGVTADLLIKETLAHSSDCQQKCILLIDEVKVKSRLVYQGHGVFGYSVDKPDKKARSILTIMMRCLHGGRSTVASMTPLYTLDARLLMELVISSMSSVSIHGGHVVALINDGLRTNTTFCTLFDNYSEKKPWIVTHPIYPSENLYLLVDPVHLLKSIRNNWITEKTKRLLLEESECSTPGSWKDIEQLYKADFDSVLRLTPLTNASVFPSPIQRQNVALVMKVIDDRTIAALQRFGATSVKPTVATLQTMSKWWKLVNVKSIGEAVRFNDKSREAITSSDCEALHALQKFGSQLKDMSSANGSKRIARLTVDTRGALWKTTMGLAALSEELITNHGFKYVLLGEFQQDALEGEFGVWRSMSGANYYMTVKDADAAFKLRGLKLLAELGALPETSSCSTTCSECATDPPSEVFDTLDKLGNHLQSLTNFQISCSVYVAGYLLKQTPELSSDGDLVSPEDAEFVLLVSRGSLIIPTHMITAWVQLSMTFMQLSNIRCHIQLTNFVEEISVLYDITPTPPKAACRRLANVLLSGVQKRDFDLSEASSRKPNNDKGPSSENSSNDKSSSSAKIRRISGI